MNKSYNFTEILFDIFTYNYVLVLNLWVELTWLDGCELDALEFSTLV